MNQIFVNIYQRFSKNKRGLTIYILAVVIFAVVFGSRLHFQEDISAIIPADKRIEEVNQVLNQSKFADQIFLNFYAKDTSAVIPDTLLEYAQKVVAALSTDTQRIEKITLNISGAVFAELYDFFYKNLPFYLTTDDYQELAQRVTTGGIEASLKKDFKSLISPAGIATKQYIFKDPLNIVPLALKRLDRFRFDQNFEVYNSSLYTKDKKHLMVLVSPVFSSSNTAQNDVLIAEIETVLANAIPENSPIIGEYYGGTAVAVANARVIKNDIIITVSVAAVALLMFFFLLFRRLRIFVLMFFPVVLGAGVSLALLAIFKGSISAIALGVGAVLLGISIDYSLHFFSHLRNSQSITTQLKELPEPIIMGSLTTASAFLCLSIVQSEALKELGWFAAISVMAAAWFVLTILPALIPAKMYLSEGQKQPKVTLFDKLAGIQFESSRFMFILVILLSFIFGFTSRHIGFNGDISTMNYLPKHLKRAEDNLKAISSETMSAVYLLTSATTLDQALAKMESLDPVFDSLNRQNLIANKTSATDLLLSAQKQQACIDQWNTFWANQDKDRVMNEITEKGKTFHFKPEAFSAFGELLQKDFKVVDESAFDQVAQLFTRNFVQVKDTLFTVVTILKVDQDKKQTFFTRFKHDDSIITFDQQYFTNSFLQVLRDDFNKLVTLSLIIVFLVLLFFFGRIELAVITYLPIILSWVWTLGLMGLFHLEFNIFNVIISTFIFGLGIDYCIFTMRGLLNDYKYGNRSLQPFRLSILLSAVTTILGIGVLAFARHPALKSIALVSVFGILSVVFVTYILLPRLFKFLILSRKSERLTPVTLTDLLNSLYVLFIFLTGAGTLLAFIPILLILPISLKRKKYLYHLGISKTLRLIIYSSRLLKKQIINQHLLNFDQPSVIIANHQSNLDLGILLMLHPKIVVLTNEWVWNSPIFKFIVRFADYYPVYKGVDSNIDQLKRKVDEGFSVLVFPEGTRSVDGKIGRFHQGAFYLANALNLDIQPVIIHGLNFCLNKKEFFLRRGIMTIKVLDRIKLKAVAEGETYRILAKKTTIFYRNEYARLTREIETPAYNQRILRSKYLYKGPVLEWYLKIKLRLEKNYEFFNDQVPYNATVTDIGCGYGFLAVMLNLTSPNRAIFGIDYDHEKISVAQHLASKTKGLEFSNANALEAEFNRSDVFILSDILHYLNPEQQVVLLHKCMDKLNLGGKIIIRDADAELQKRTKVTRITEFFSIKVLRFNQSVQSKLSYTTSSRLHEIASEKGFGMKKYDNATLTSNITYILERFE